MSILLPENAVTVIQGTSKTLSLTVKDGNGDVVNLTGATVYFTVKKSLQERDPVIQKISTDSLQIEIPNPTDGTAKIFIIPEDTSVLATCRYKYDVLVELSSGDRFVVVGPSVFEVKPGVTVLM